MEQQNKDRTSLLGFIIAIPLAICLLASSVSASKLYTGGKVWEQDGVIALTLTLNGERIEWVYKENLAQCLKSKRFADREIRGERVIFACQIVKGKLQEDKQTKYGIRLLEILE
mgnify:CR=1 FL=1